MTFEEYHDKTSLVNEGRELYCFGGKELYNLDIIDKNEAIINHNKNLSSKEILQYLFDFGLHYQYSVKKD